MYRFIWSPWPEQIKLYLFNRNTHHITNHYSLQLQTAESPPRVNSNQVWFQAPSIHVRTRLTANYKSILTSAITYLGLYTLGTQRTVYWARRMAPNRAQMWRIRGLRLWSLSAHSRLRLLIMISLFCGLLGIWNKMKHILTTCLSVYKAQ